MTHSSEVNRARNFAKGDIDTSAGNGTVCSTNTGENGYCFLTFNLNLRSHHIKSAVPSQWENSVYLMTFATYFRKCELVWTHFSHFSILMICDFSRDMRQINFSTVKFKRTDDRRSRALIKRTMNYENLFSESDLLQKPTTPMEKLERLYKDIDDRRQVRDVSTIVCTACAGTVHISHYVFSWHMDIKRVVFYDLWFVQWIHQ